MSDLSQSKLIRIPFSGFLKLELPRFTLRVLDIVDSHNPEELKIKEMFDLLEAEKPRIARLKDKYGPHPLTFELNSMREMRTFYISSLRFHLKKANKEMKSSHKVEVTLVNNELNHFFNNLELSKNEEMFIQKINLFFDAIEANEELESSFSTLGFTEQLNNLRHVHSSIKSLINTRLRSISKRKGETTAQLRKYVIVATTNLVKQIEIAPFMNPDIDYSSLFNELNQLITEYKNLINKRVLFNKRKAAGEIDIESAESTESTTTTQLDESEGRMMPLSKELLNVEFPYVEEATKDGLSYEEPVEMKKAAAMSSKTLQLPDVNNENQK